MYELVPSRYDDILHERKSCFDYVILAFKFVIQLCLAFTWSVGVMVFLPYTGSFDKGTLTQLLLFACLLIFFIFVRISSPGTSVFSLVSRFCIVLGLDTVAVTALVSAWFTLLSYVLPGPAWIPKILASGFAGSAVLYWRYKRCNALYALGILVSGFVLVLFTPSRAFTTARDRKLVHFISLVHGTLAFSLPLLGYMVFKWYSKFWFPFPSTRHSHENRTRERREGGLVLQAPTEDEDRLAVAPEVRHGAFWTSEGLPGRKAFIIPQVGLYAMYLAMWLVEY